MTAALRVEPPHSATTASAVRPLVLVSAACLLVQTAATDYGSSGRGAAVVWTLVGLLLLWRVYRHRGRVARGLIIISSCLGAVIHGLSAFEDPRAALLSAAFLGQALPLLAPAVRGHVQHRPALGD